MLYRDFEGFLDSRMSKEVLRMQMNIKKEAVEGMQEHLNNKRPA